DFNPICSPDARSQIPGMDKQIETGKSKALTDYPRAQWRIDDGVKICLSHCLTRRIYQLSPPLARGPFNSFTRLLRPCPLHQITSHDRCTGACRCADMTEYVKCPPTFAWRWQHPLIFRHLLDALTEKIQTPDINLVRCKLQHISLPSVYRTYQSPKKRHLECAPSIARTTSQGSSRYALASLTPTGARENVFL